MRAGLGLGIDENRGAQKDGGAESRPAIDLSIGSADPAGEIEVGFGGAAKWREIGRTVGSSAVVRGEIEARDGGAEFDLESGTGRGSADLAPVIVDGPGGAEERPEISTGAGSAEAGFEIERRDGGADDRPEVDARLGSAILALRCATWQDVQKARLAAQQRGLADLGEALKKIEDQAARQIKKELVAQPVWPWLSQYPGLGGVHVARLVAMIADPHRFPGQKCSEGHTVGPDYAVGDPCPVEGLDGTTCAGTMLIPRTTTGVRSLWHYLGLHVGEDGKMPRRRKGHRVDWNPEGRTICLMPGGLAEQIVRLRVPKYRDIYDAAKARLNETRAVDVREVGFMAGPQAGTEAEYVVGSDTSSGLRPIEIEKRARMIAVKAFAGDLLMAMKRAAVLHEIGGHPGAQGEGGAAWTSATAVVAGPHLILGVSA